jgi:hypothetical protein
MGIYWHLFAPLFTARPNMMFAPRFPRPAVVPSPANTLQAIKQTGASLACAVPSFLEVCVTVLPVVAFSYDHL